VSVRANSDRDSGAAKWPQQYAYLKREELQSVDPKDAKAMVDAGKAIVVDVRPKKAFAKSHVAGSVSIPLYQELNVTTGNVLAKVAKFVIYAANGVAPIEPNEDFVEQAKVNMHTCSMQICWSAIPRIDTRAEAEVGSALPASRTDAMLLLPRCAARRPLLPARAWSSCARRVAP
jgi:hypothetical protein